MSSIATELLSANAAKIDLSAALVEKGISVPESISGYGDAIRNLGGDSITMPDIQGSKGGTVTIPNGVEKIGPYAFAYNDSLTLVKIPKSVVYCDPTAFAYSQHVRLEAPVIFKDMPMLSDLVDSYITSGQTDGNYTSADANGTTWKYIVSNEMAAITGITGECPHDLEVPAFFGDTPVRKIQSYGTNTTGAFYNKPMYSLKLPYSLTAIDNTYTFLSCKNLSSIDIPESVQTIGGYAFQYCAGLISAHIPSSISSFSASMFHTCTNLETVKVENGLTSLGTNTFLYSGLKRFDCPDSYITQSGMGRAFGDCKSLSSYNGNNTEVLSSSQWFRGCTALQYLDFPKLKVIGKIFGTTSSHTQGSYKLTSLTYLSLPSIEKIISGTFGYSASQQYTSISLLEIPNKTFEEIIAMDDYATWYLDPYCVIKARDRSFYYSLQNNVYPYST